MYTHYIYKGKESETKFCSDKEFISFLLLCIGEAKKKDIGIYPRANGVQIVISEKNKDDVLHVFHEFNESDALRLYNALKQYRDGLNEK